MTLNNKIYDAMKWVTMIVLPATSSAYYGLAGIWGLPYPEQVSGTLAITATFFGIVLGLSTSAYNKSDQKFNGVFDVDTVSNPEKDIYSLNVNDEFENLAKLKQITLKVQVRENPLSQ